MATKIEATTISRGPFPREHSALGRSSAPFKNSVNLSYALLLVNDILDDLEL
jgi:hypothetical protein